MSFSIQSFDKEVNEILRDVSEDDPPVYLDHRSVTYQTLETRNPDGLDDVIESAETLLKKAPDYVDNSRKIEPTMDWSVTEKDIAEGNITNISFTKIPVNSESFTKLNDIRDKRVESKETSPAIIKIEVRIYFDFYDIFLFFRYIYI